MHFYHLIKSWYTFWRPCCLHIAWQHAPFVFVLSKTCFKKTYIFAMNKISLSKMNNECCVLKKIKWAILKTRSRRNERDGSIYKRKLTRWRSVGLLGTNLTRKVYRRWILLYSFPSVCYRYDICQLLVVLHVFISLINNK